MLFGSHVRTVRLIMCSCVAMMSGRRLLTTLVHCEHGSTVGAISHLGGLDVHLDLLTGSLVLVVVDCIADVRRQVTLRVLASLGTRPTERPGVPEPSTWIAGSGTHVR